MKKEKKGCLPTAIISIVVLMFFGGIANACGLSNDKNQDTETTAVSDTIKIIDATTGEVEGSLPWVDERFEKKTEPVTEEKITEKVTEKETEKVTEPPKKETEPPKKVAEPAKEAKKPDPPKQEDKKPATQPVQTVKPDESNIKIISDPSPVVRNEDATLSVQGAPNSEARIYVYYSSGASKAKGLEKKTTDDSGNVSWTWTIGGKTKPGTYSITVQICDDEIEIPLVVKE